jgi:dihydrofolate reductase
MASYWPSATENDPFIADKMNNLPKIVFSKTLEKVEWKNSRLVKGNIAEEISKLKLQPGKDMVIFGSGRIVSTFAQLGLIDEYRIIVEGVPSIVEIPEQHPVHHYATGSLFLLENPKTRVPGLEASA